MNLIAKCGLAAAACVPLTVPTVAGAATTKSDFSSPSGLTSDAAGDVFVANSGSGRISEITPGLTIKTIKLKSTVAGANSVAVDSSGNLFVSYAQGGVTEFSPTGSVVQQITANAAQPLSIAVDSLDDLYIASSSGLALDDPDGTSLSSNIDPYHSSADSVAVGGSSVYALGPEAEDYANGSFALRQLSLQGTITGFGSTDADYVGTSCAAPAAPEVRGECWTADAAHNQLIHIAAVEADSATLSYPPNGIAYVASKGRVFVSDASQNTINIYKTTSPYPLVKTLH